MTDTAYRLPEVGQPGLFTAGPADFLTLLKPRVMSLVVFTGFVGLMAAPGQLHPVLAAVAVLCIAIGSGAAGAINMWYDRDIDAVMTRTAKRPIPMGVVAPEDALVFGVVLAVGSVMVMALAVNYVAAGLLASAILFYVFIYTMWLKRRTPQNIVIGGAAGAFPPLIGWAAVTGDVGLGGLALFSLIFFWTPPHFWALALYRSGDYERAGVPMLPVVAGPVETKKQILLYTILLIPLAAAPVWVGAATWFYGVPAVVFSVAFLGFAIAVWLDKSDRAPKRMFRFSILYLFVLFTLLLIDTTLMGA
ncbi:MAG: protoheme IX farnesyltransferase [Alphaproteobacteria bacterium]